MVLDVESIEARTGVRDGNTRWPDFYIVGAPKAGTTSLFEYLRQHPEIHFSRFKETHFFGSDLTWRKRVVPRQVVLDAYVDAPQETLLGDASVFYLVSTQAATEIHEANPEARIIAMIRNPLTMIPSLYQQGIRTGDETQYMLAKAMDLEPSRKGGNLDMSPDNPGVMQQLYYSEIARYSDQLARFFDAFGRNRVLVIEFDAFVREPTATVSKVFEFLGLANMAIEVERHNEAWTPRNWLLVRVFRHPFGPLRMLWRAVLPARVRRRILLGAESLVFKKAKTEVSPEDRRRIAKLYASDVAKIEAMTGLDLDAWRRDFDAALGAIPGDADGAMENRTR